MNPALKLLRIAFQNPATWPAIFNNASTIFSTLLWSKSGIQFQAFTENKAIGSADWTSQTGAVSEDERREQKQLRLAERQRHQRQ